MSSLDNTVELLLHSSRISFAFSTREILKSAQLGVQSLRETLKSYNENKNNSLGVMAIDVRIRDEARRLEDAIESQLQLSVFPNLKAMAESLLTSAT